MMKITSWCFDLKRQQNLGLATCLVASMAFVILITTGATAADSPSTGTLPVTIEPKGDDALMQMSLGQWDSYLQRLDRQKIDDAKQLAPKGLPIPKTSATKNPLDVWTKSQIKGIAVTPGGNGHQSAVGAAYAIGPNLKLGVGTELNEAPSQRHTVDRIGVAARLKFNDWRLVPQASLTDERIQPYVDGTSAPDDPLAAPSTSTRLEIAPELRRPFTLEEGDIIEPFVNFKSSVGLGGSGPQDASGETALDKVGVGLSLSRPSDYKLEVTADIEGVADEENRDVSSRVKLAVPFD